MAKKEFTFEVKKHCGVISMDGSKTTELNFIAYGDAAPKYDLRKWRTINGTKSMLKGITLNAEELRTLRDLLNSMEDM